jgi:hypothetical protein
MRDVVTALGNLDPMVLSGNRSNGGAKVGRAVNGRPHQ